jgi:hypothetical protein
MVKLSVRTLLVAGISCIVRVDTYLGTQEQSFRHVVHGRNDAGQLFLFTHAI